MRTGIAVALCAVGLFFSLSGAIGVWRMPDLYTRVQAATKTITLGALPTLVGVVVASGASPPYLTRAMLVGFLLLTLNPAASHALVRAAYKTGTPQWRHAVSRGPGEVAQRRAES